MPARPRDLPRRAAPVLFGLFNLSVGSARVLDPNVHNPALAQVPGSLRTWGWLFIVAGVLVLTAAWSRPMAWISAACAVGLWVVWAYLIRQARVIDPTQVPLTGPVTSTGIAVLHSLLVPYRRDRRRLDGRSR